MNRYIRVAHVICCASERGGLRVTHQRNDLIMLYTIAVILVVLWLLGLVTSYTVGGFVHILIVLAIVAIVVRLLQGRKVV